MEERKNEFLEKKLKPEDEAYSTTKINKEWITNEKWNFKNQHLDRGCIKAAIECVLLQGNFECGYQSIESHAINSTRNKQLLHLLK